MYPIYYDRSLLKMAPRNDFEESSLSSRAKADPRTSWAARVLGSARPAACNAPPPTPRALRAARRARMRGPVPCDGLSPPRLPMRGDTLPRRALPLSARADTPPPGAVRAPCAEPSAEPSSSPAACGAAAAAA